MNMKRWCNDDILLRESRKESNWTDACPSVTLSIANLKWSGLVMKPNLRDGSQVTHRLNPQRERNEYTAVPVHTIKAQRRRRVTDSVFLNTCINLTRGYVDYRVSVGDLEKIESFAPRPPARSRSLDRPTCSVVTILTELPLLSLWESKRDGNVNSLYLRYSW